MILSPDAEDRSSLDDIVCSSPLAAEEVVHPPRQTFLPTPPDAIAPLAYVDEPPELLLERDPEGNRQEATEHRPPRTVALIPRG
jgi:hypothetical protein